MFNLHGYAPLLLKGVAETVVIGLASMLGAVVWGLILCGLRTVPWRPLRYGIDIYMTVVRAVPELVMVLVLYYGLPNLVQEIAGYWGYDINVNLPSFWAALVALASIYGAFCAEVFRSARLQIPKGCLEAAYTLGLSSFTTFRAITLPLAAARAVAGLSNVWMTLIKATAVISAIQLPELMYSTELAAHATHLPFNFYLVACFLYLGITTLSLFGQVFFERRLREFF